MIYLNPNILHCHGLSMLNDYFPIAILTFLALFVAVFVAGLGFLFGPKRRQSEITAL